MEILLYILLTLMLAAVAMLTMMLVRQSKAEERIVDRLMEELEDDQRELRMELTDSVHKNVRNLGSLIAESQQSAYRAQSEEPVSAQAGDGGYGYEDRTAARHLLYGKRTEA